MKVNVRQSKRDRDSHRIQMENRILRAALKLFAKKELKDVTIRKIASVIGYSPGIVYHYFDNKESIFLRIREDGLENLHRNLSDAVESETGLSRLVAYTRTFLDFAFEQPEYYEIMFLAPLPKVGIRTEDKKTASSEMFTLLVDEVQAAIESGYLRKPKRPRRLALLLFSSMHGLVALAKRQRLMIPEPKVLTEALEESLSMLIQYIQVDNSQRP